MFGNFPLVPATDWQLGQEVKGERRERLLATTFNTIANLLVQETTVDSYVVEPSNKLSGATRLKCMLLVPSTTIDLFHNGAGGYRAQYYLGVGQGETANRYLLDALLDKLRKITKQSAEGCTWQTVEASLAHPGAKIWIDEGGWLFDGPGRWNLHVDFWEHNAHKITMASRFEAGWARLVPEVETRLELKGGWVDRCCRPVEGGPKPSLLRSEQIHNHGYT